MTTCEFINPFLIYFNNIYYLIAFCLYIDGVNTIISMATAYGKALGLGDTDLLLALLVTQFVAFPATIVFARITKHFKTSTLIYVCLFAYIGITLFAVTLVHPIQFWMLAIFVGLFQGGIQGLSRSYFGCLWKRSRLLRNFPCQQRHSNYQP